MFARSTVAKMTSLRRLIVPVAVLCCLAVGCGEDSSPSEPAETRGTVIIQIPANCPGWTGTPVYVGDLFVGMFTPAGRVGFTLEQGTYVVRLCSPMGRVFQTVQVVAGRTTVSGQSVCPLEPPGCG